MLHRDSQISEMIFFFWQHGGLAFFFISLDPNVIFTSWYNLQSMWILLEPVLSFSFPLVFCSNIVKYNYAENTIHIQQSSESQGLPLRHILNYAELFCFYYTGSLKHRTRSLYTESIYIQILSLLSSAGIHSW